MTAIRRVEIYRNEDYEVVGDLLDTVLFLHLTIHDWSPSVYKGMLLVLDELKTELPKYGIHKLYAWIEDDIKKHKLVTMLGFDVIETYPKKGMSFGQDCY